MRAFVLKENGGIENLVMTQVNDPEIKPREVLIKVKAIAINPVDATVRQNNLALMSIVNPANLQQGTILGWDIAGTVVQAGSEVQEWQGKDVFGMVNFPGEGKAYAEFCAAPVDQLAEKPVNVSFEEAAAATLAALTAWQALVTHAKVKSGDRVLIHAAAGGVGHYAVQIARHLGAYVIGTASAANREFLLTFNVNQFIDYTKEKFEEMTSDINIVLDSVNRENLARSIQTVKSGGTVISIKGNIDEGLQVLARNRNVHLYRMLVRSDGKDMVQIAKLMEAGKLMSHISRIFSFENLPKAHLEIEKGRTRGKIVIVM